MSRGKVIPKEDPSIYNPENIRHDNGVDHRSITMALENMYNKKNEDYGNSFEKSLDKRGLVVAIMRMEEKLERADKLNETGKTLVEDESLVDSIMDLANYAIMTAMWVEKTGGK